MSADLSLSNSLVEDEVLKFSQNVQIVRDSVEKSRDKINSLSSLISDWEKADVGFPLLEAKIHTIIPYIVELLEFSLLKVSRKSIIDSDVIKNLIGAKVYLDRIRGLEEKCKPRINKCLEARCSNITPEEGKTDEDNRGLLEIAIDDPCKFKPNLEDLEQFKGSNSKGGSLYKAPKLFATEFEDNKTKKLRRIESEKKKLSSSRIVKELANEVFDTPEVHTATGIGYTHDELRSNKYISARNEREAYEEEYMTRIQSSRSDRKLNKRLLRSGFGMSLNEEVNALENDIKSIRKLARSNLIEEEYMIPGESPREKPKKSIHSEPKVDVNSSLAKESQARHTVHKSAIRKTIKRLKKREKKRK